MTTGYPGHIIIIKCSETVLKGHLVNLDGSGRARGSTIHNPFSPPIGVAAEDSIDGKVLVELYTDPTYEEDPSLGSTSSSRSRSSSKSSSKSVMPETIPKKKKLPKSKIETIPKKKDVKKIKDIILNRSPLSVDSTSAEMRWEADSSSSMVMDVTNLKIRMSPLEFVKKFYKSYIK